MSRSVSVIVPVRDGARYLRELLDAVAAEPADEILVVDSGSRDGSVDIARAAGARVLEIDPADFGHGRTRNLAASEASGDVLAFLTQDATPAPGWLSAHLEALDLDPRVGVSFGPHLPRPDTSPMIARELTEFFGSFSPDGAPVLQGPGDEPFLSNVNACYRRTCWEEIRFRDVAYSEDQAFGRDALEAGWLKVYHPGAGVLHAHDYGPVEFARRYFDEYRGLRETTGHVEPVAPRESLSYVKVQVAGDRAWMASQGLSRADAARWTVRSVVHHGGRRVFSALGSRADRLPLAVRGAISLEGRTDGGGGDHDGVAVETPPEPSGRVIPPKHDAHPLDATLRVLRDGPAPLLPVTAEAAERERLRIAVVIPHFREGSGGHRTICTLVRGLEARGHVVSLWLHDPAGIHAGDADSVVRSHVDSWFGPVAAPVYKGFSQWHGADVVVATGWQTVHPALLLDQVRARAYLVQDHEPEFYATSADRMFAEDTYHRGLYVIAASPWLRDLVRDQYGADGTAFELGVDHTIYGADEAIPRRDDTVVFYGRGATPRRATELGWLALAELRQRRPDVRIVAYGDSAPNWEQPFPYEFLGVVTPVELAALYRRATAGLVLSLTNYSLIPQEMMACGLPLVDLRGGCSEAMFGEDGPVELANADPVALADALERLLDDPAEWSRRSTAGLSWAAERTWDAAVDAVEHGLRESLRVRVRDAV
ncbi:MAG: glycosyltransferase [Solirubrobacteraceae bacterium]|nr:glycosyltransferase [Solirubrobacteraceae bacterium]